MGHFWGQKVGPSFFFDPHTCKSTRPRLVTEGPPPQAFSYRMYCKFSKPREALNRSVLDRLCFSIKEIDLEQKDRGVNQKID
jgi:hypothetical protein